MALLQTSHSQRSEASYPKMSSGRIPSVEGGIQPTIFDAKADILTATAADTPARLAVGANDTVLTADSSTATGLKWAAVAAGGMTSLASGNLSGTATLSLTNISGSYNYLIFSVLGATDAGASQLRMQFNSDTGSNYSNTRFGSNTTTLTNESGIAYITVSSGTSTASRQSAWVTIPNYASTTSYKPVNIISNNATLATLVNGFYLSASAITSIQFFNADAANFSGGTYTLWGVK